jgi:hypothetical protein
MQKKISTLDHIPKQIPTLNQYVQKIFHTKPIFLLGLQDICCRGMQFLA